MKNLFLLSAQRRMGSTLLQRMLNQREKTMIWGESGRIVRRFHDIYLHLYQFAEAAKNRSDMEEYFATGKNPNVWIACINPHKEYIRNMAVTAVREGLLKLYEEYSEKFDIIGFKEVTLTIKEVGLLYDAFPKAEYILLVRNPFDTWKSTQGFGKYYNSVFDFAFEWNNNVMAYSRFAYDNKNVSIVRYEDIIKFDNSVLDMIADIGEMNKEDMKEALGNNPSGRSSVDISDEDCQTIISNCKLGMKEFGYDWRKYEK